MRLTDLLAAIPRLERAVEHANLQHHALVKAVSAGDSSAARRVMEEHLDATAALIDGSLG